MILVVGIATFVGGIVLVLRHLHVWRRQVDATEDPRARRIFARQLRRRCLTSTCIAVLGFVIALLHFKDYWSDGRESGYVILVSCALTLIFMIFVLASLDFLAVSHLVRSQRSRTRESAEELAREYHRLQKKKQLSGEGDSRPPTDGN